MTSSALRPKFWQQYALHELTSAEWEALCDGCGLCCLIKFIDDDDGVVEYTDVACRLLDCATGLCQNYANRQQYVPDCIHLTMDNLPDMLWLPKTCAYKRLYLGQDLPHWHYLKAGKAHHSKQIAKIGAGGRCVCESYFDDDEQIQERIVRWVSI